MWILVSSLKPYCNIYDNCGDPNTANFENCLNSLSDFLCIQKLPEEAVDDLCMGANGLVELSQRKDIGNKAEKILEWYKTKLTPCVTNVCKDSKYPVDRTNFEDAPGILVKDFCEGGEPSVESEIARFFRLYWWIFAILVGIIIVIIISYCMYETPKKE